MLINTMDGISLENSNLQFSESGVGLDPSQSLVHGIIERRKIRIIHSVAILVREELECSKVQVWDIYYILAVNTLRSVECRSQVLHIGGLPSRF